MTPHSELGTAFLVLLAFWAARWTYYRGKRHLHMPKGKSCDCRECGGPGRGASLFSFAP